MSCSAKPLFSILLPSVCLFAAGCQRSMTGSLASGPFAPAGTAVQAGNAPLIPMGPITGATRVPPPATGSSSTTNSYLGTPSASNFGGGSSLQAGGPSSEVLAVSNGAVGGAMSPAATFRNSLGGMNVIDLTNQNPPANGYPGNPMIASYPTAPVGSGVAAPAQQPADLLRPIDQPFAAMPIPRYRGMEDASLPLPAPAPFVAGVQPAGGLAAASSDSWQTIQPAAVQVAATPSSSQVAPSSLRGTMGGSSPGPSTEPISRTANTALPWRSPTTAR